MRTFWRFCAVALVGAVLATNAMPFVALAQTSTTTTATSTPQYPPPSCGLSVNPSAIAPGGSVTLTWGSNNSTGGNITGVGPVGPQGSINLLPSIQQQVTTFAGTFWGLGGTTTCQASVQVVFGPDQYTSAPAGGVTNGVGDTAGNTTAAGTVITGGTVAQTPAPTAPTTQAAPLQSANGGLVPCGTGSYSGSGTDQNSSTGCQACNLAQLIQNIINFVIGLSIPIAAALFAWAGILLFTSADNVGKRDQAKKIFKNAFIGFAIAITGWLVVDTLLHVLFTGSTTIQSGSWFTIQCDQGTRTVNSTVSNFLSSLAPVNTTAPPTLAVQNVPAQYQAMTGGVLYDDRTGCAFGSAWDATVMGCVNADGDVTQPVGYGGGIQAYTPPTSFTTCDSGDILQQDGSCLDSFGDDYTPYTVTNATSGPQGACPVGYRYAQSGDGSYEDWCQGPGGSDDVQDFISTKSTGSTVQCSGSSCSSIYDAALAYQGLSTAAGPDGGNKACAWAVNNILASSGNAPIDGNSVAQMKAILDDSNSGRGTAVDQSQAQPGDLVFFGGLSHVGICANVGCSQTLSNSSSQAVFAPTNSNGINPAQGSTFYHVY